MSEGTLVVTVTEVMLPGFARGRVLDFSATPGLVLHNGKNKTKQKKTVLSPKERCTYLKKTERILSI